jgi:hypothetical protein
MPIKDQFFCNIPNNYYAFSDHDMSLIAGRLPDLSLQFFLRNRTPKNLFGDSQAVLATTLFKLQGYRAGLPGFFAPFIARISLRRLAAGGLILKF